MRKCLAVLILLVTIPAFADQVSKDAKLAHLMELTGLRDMLKQQREDSFQQTMKIGQQMLTEFDKQVPGGDKEAMKSLKQAYEKFLTNASPSWTVEVAISAYARFYGEQLSESDVDQIVAFYESPVGQKDISADRSAFPKWTAFLAEKNEAAQKKATDAFIADVKAVIERLRAKQH